MKTILMSTMIMSLAFCRVRCDEQLLFSHCSVNNSLQYISLFNLSASREKEIKRFFMKVFVTQMIIARMNICDSS